MCCLYVKVKCSVCKHDFDVLQHLQTGLEAFFVIGLLQNGVLLVCQGTVLWVGCTVSSVCCRMMCFVLMIAIACMSRYRVVG